MLGRAADFLTRRQFTPIDKAFRAGLKGMGRLAGRTTRAAVREALPLAESAAWTGYGLGMRAGFTGAAMAGQTVRAAGMVGGAAAYGAYRAAGMGLKVLGMGRSPIRLEKATIPFTNYQVGIPQLTTSAKLMLGAASVPLAVGMGVNDYVQRNRWNLSHAQATGQVEVEREDFLGATGSLTLASYNNRNGGRGGINTAGLQTAAAHHLDDVLVAGLHTIL